MPFTPQALKALDSAALSRFPGRFCARKSILQKKAESVALGPLRLFGTPIKEALQGNLHVVFRYAKLKVSSKLVHVRLNGDLPNCCQFLISDLTGNHYHLSYTFGRSWRNSLVASVCLLSQPIDSPWFSPSLLISSLIGTPDHLPASQVLF